MKKIFGLLIGVVVLMMSFVSATTTTLSDPEINMSYFDVRTIQFCNVGSDTPIDVFVNPICKDVDGLFGCQTGDELNPIGFNIVSDKPMLPIYECATLILTTSLAQDEGGVFYYTANGMVGATVVGSETGKVNAIPEFTTLGSGLLLLGAGVFVMRKRKKE